MAPSSDPDEKPVIRFRVRRGTFTIEHGLRDTDPDEWARRYASSLPAPGATVSSVRDGEVDRFTWRIITPYRSAY